MLDESATSVDPKGLGRVLLVVSILFLILTAIIVILRCVVRLKYRLFGIDDGLMLIGWILHVVFTAAGLRAIYAGVGTKDKDLNAYLQVDGRKWMWIGQLIYSFSLTPLKSSICVTLLRIAVTKTHRIIVWATLVFTIITMMYSTIGTFFACMPISANWTDREKCSLPFLISLGYVVSISAVISDWICAILPIFMLYKSHMRKATKVSVSIILGLAALASLCTIVRLPYLSAFSHPDNYLYNVGNIVLWSTLESGIGIIAGSLPSLRKLVSSHFHFDSSTGSSPAHITPFSGTSRAVITSQSVSAARRTHRGEVGDNWEQLDDVAEGTSSPKIYVKVDLEMQSLERPETSRESHGSREDLLDFEWDNSTEKFDQPCVSRFYMLVNTSLASIMLSFLRSSGPARTQNAQNNPILYEGGKSSVTFSGPGSKYIMTHRIPPTNKENGVSIIAPPFHYHIYQDEFFRVQSGKGNFYRGLDAKPFAVLSDDPDGQATASVKAGYFHRFENATEDRDLVVDIHLTPESYENEQQFFRNFFGYLDDCKASGSAPSIFQLLVFLHSADTPLVIPIPWEFFGRVVSRILLTTAAYWGRFVLGYKQTYPEYYDAKKSI
ncbi:integral membrane protein PTH11 [Fusarium bulbicola]|nr:integral membrane protein PTH11 [Fusarium bulbicola]